ncbi:MAG TPA: NAD(P)-binding domain-containing protein [Candidatus Saccharimonadales bacterium]|jgi:predicted dinucleotide-binding enzyme|nr:NAD(P)-binding domain-containing protein [Candidatus Saccharimonadales bacterium]
MTSKARPIIGIIGAGRLGTAIARQSLKSGYGVNITNSRGPQSLEFMLGVLLPGAKALTVHDLIKKSDLVILAMPLNKYNTLNPTWLADKIVIDAMNYWPPTEGEIPEFMDAKVTSSEYLQQYFKGVRLVKTLNHVAYNEIEEHSLSLGTPQRRAIALAGDDIEAKASVEQFIDALGFDPIDLGDLRQGSSLQPDTPLFNARLTKKQIEQVTQH